MFGANVSPYQQPGEWQMNVSYRDLTSDHHWNGRVEQVQRHTLGTYVINTQKALDISVSYAFSERFNLTVGVPFVAATWGVPSPIAIPPGPGPRATERGRGLGDISVTGRSWLFNTRTHLNWNIGVGGGLKLPTGNSNYQDSFPPITGGTPREAASDMSVQPGDGGWGVMLEAQGFRRIKRAFVFGSGNYLLNPRNTNDTLSVIAGLGIARTPANASRYVNSVPDQYITRLGGGVSLGKGFGALTAWRVEGLPRYDLIGRSDGFRRPGVAMFIEPGVSYARGRNSFTFNLPIGFFYNRPPDAYSNAPGDATFPRVIALGSYSVKFGGKGAAAPAPVTTTPATGNTAPQ